MSKRVTIYDIAQATGVSPSTVSRVLNNSSLIGDDNAERIRAKAEELGYKPRAIKRQAQRAILNVKLVLPNRAERYLNQFYDPSVLIEGIKNGASPSRVQLVAELEDRGLDLFSHKKGGDIDGVIFAFTQPQETIYDDLKQRGIPHLTLNRELPEKDYVVIDELASYADVVAQWKSMTSAPLTAAYINLLQPADVAERRETAFFGACNEAGVDLPSDPAVRVERLSDLSPEHLAPLVAKGVNGVACFNDMVAIRVRELWPDENQPMLAGFDNMAMRELLRSSPMSVSLPVNEMAEAAGQWLVRRIIERDDTSMRLKFPGELVL